MMPRQITTAILVSTLLTTASAAIALPESNKQGDYTNTRRGSFHKHWQVVDPDPKGLNCRLSDRFRDTSADSMDGPINTFYQAKPNISNWPVVYRFRPQNHLEAVSGNLSNQLILQDQRNEPWLAVRVISRGQAMDCFVRANARFIKPINNQRTQPN